MSANKVTQEGFFVVVFFDHRRPILTQEKPCVIIRKGEHMRSWLWVQCSCAHMHLVCLVDQRASHGHSLLFCQIRFQHNL